MTTIANLLGDNLLAVVEALAANDQTGLTRAEIVRSSKVPKSTVPRIVQDFEGRGLVVQVDKKGKAPVYRLNSGEIAVVELVRVLNEFTVRVMDAESNPEWPEPVSIPSPHRLTIDTTSIVLSYPSGSILHGVTSGIQRLHAGHAETAE